MFCNLASKLAKVGKGISMERIIKLGELNVCIHYSAKVPLRVLQAVSVWVSRDSRFTEVERIEIVPYLAGLNIRVKKQVRMLTKGTVFKLNYYAGDQEKYGTDYAEFACIVDDEVIKKQIKTLKPRQ